jgi:hypothetical protein
MNKTSLAITALAIVAATAIGFVSTQSAAAQLSLFNTNNAASQSSTQTGTATGGAGGNGGVGIGGSANGGRGGDASVDQGVCQQIAQSGAFGSSTNSITARIHKWRIRCGDQGDAAAPRRGRD